MQNERGEAVNVSYRGREFNVGRRNARKYMGEHVTLKLHVRNVVTILQALERENEFLRNENHKLRKDLMVYVDAMEE
jgi:hypothetical protein